MESMRQTSRATRRARRLVCALVAGCSLASAADSDKSGSERVAATPGESINATKREFEAMKASRDPAQQQKGALPKMTTPELHQGSGSSEPRPWSSNSSKNNKLDSKGKKSANWLVDAMDKDARERRAKERGEPERTADERDALANKADTFGAEQSALEKSDEDVSAAVAAGERNRVEVKDKPEVVNPLNQFLGQWMTSRDYAALRPALDESGSKGATDSRGIAGAAMPLPGVTANRPSESFVQGGFGLPPAPVPGPRENPYLQTLQPSPTLPLVSSASATPPPTTSILPAPVVVPPPPPVITPPPSKIPDFAKPAQDEKYFKQLKRF